MGMLGMRGSDRDNGKDGFNLSSVENITQSKTEDMRQRRLFVKRAKGFKSRKSI